MNITWHDGVLVMRLVMNVMTRSYSMAVHKRGLGSPKSGVGSWTVHKGLEIVHRYQHSLQFMLW